MINLDFTIWWTLHHDIFPRSNGGYILFLAFEKVTKGKFFVIEDLIKLGKTAMENEEQLEMPVDKDAHEI